MSCRCRLDCLKGHIIDNDMNACSSKVIHLSICQSMLKIRSTKNCIIRKFTRGSWLITLIANSIPTNQRSTVSSIILLPRTRNMFLNYSFTEQTMHTMFHAKKSIHKQRHYVNVISSIH